MKLKFKRWIQLSLGIASLGLISYSIYLHLIWPDWQEYAVGPIQKSAFIKTYEQMSPNASIHWETVSLSNIPKEILAVFIVAEDNLFCRHRGMALKSLKRAMEKNWEAGNLIYGGSSITQQTVKNLFLTPEKTLLRKWHEAIFAISMDKALSKRRILEIYLNIVEFSPGIYGIETASKHYFGISANALTPDQAIQLAANLPAPSSHNIQTQTKFYLEKKSKIESNYNRVFINNDGDIYQYIKFLCLND